MKRYGAIVIGGGAMGSAVSHALAKRGVERIALFERARPGAGATGSSPGIARVYHSDWYLANLAAESFPSLESFLGPAHSRAGAIYFDPDWKIARLRQEVGRLNGRGCRLEILTPAIGRERFPRLEWGNDLAVFEPRAGFLDPLNVVRAWLGGGEVFSDAPVDAILMRGHRAAGVVVAGREVEAENVIVCAGSESPVLLEPLGIKLPMKTRDVTRERYRARGGGSIPVVYDRARAALVRPWEADEFLVEDFTAATARVGRLAGAVRQEGATVRESVADDGRGVALQVARNLVVATGWSGFSFSVVPAVARRVAEMVG